jgi:DNA-damage-inducible protein D
VLLGYSKWENFLKVIEKAKLACENAGKKTENHLHDIRKMVQIGSNNERVIEEV